MIPRPTPVNDAGSAGPLDVEAALRRRRSDLERWAARMGGPMVGAEDVAQEVMMVAHARLPEFHFRSCSPR